MAIRGLGSGGVEHTTGDSPLQPLATFSGRVDLFAQVLPYQGFFMTGGTFTLSGLPAGASIRKAWVQLTSFDLQAGRPVGLTFAGVPQAARLADAVDPGDIYFCSMYRFDVTALIAGNGAYSYTTSTHHYAYGDSLIVVYEHPSLPERTIAILDGSESLMNSTTTSAFEGLPAGPGVLKLFTQADGDVGSGESVRLNSALVAGPGDVFGANVGLYASLVSLPVTALAGDNVLDVTTGGDWFGFHFAALSVLGLTTVTLDFETEDDGTTPLHNGQAISSPPEFGDLVRISGAGANAGPAIFDSTPGGPNDPAINDDMLVGHGNMLLLQDNRLSTQTVPGFFDLVTDDEDGGDMIFDFTTQVDPRSILLADINPPPNLGASVTLVDEGNRTRIYTVQPGWTGAYGNAGPYRLDLTTLAAQPGNGTPRWATAAETPGFLQGHVVRLVVHMTGFGAVDDLEVSIPNLLR